jgi:LPS export ABC transporter protein LptC
MVKSVMTTIVVLTLFSCEGNFKKIQKFNLKDGAPFAEGKNIDLKYTDSGKVVTNLIASKLIDYSTLEFPYQEFPEGVEVHFWDKNKENIVTSDYAIRYDKTGIVDLRRNVVIVTSDSLTLEAEQLYWNQKDKWVFTDGPYRFVFKDGSYNDGGGLDSSEDFKEVISRKNQGVQIIDKTKIDEE